MKRITDQVRICQHYKFDGDNCKCCVYWMETLKGITMIDWGYSIVFTKMSKKEDTKYIYTMIKVMLNNITTWIKTKNVKIPTLWDFYLRGVKLWILFLNCLQCDNVSLMMKIQSICKILKREMREHCWEKTQH